MVHMVMCHSKLSTVSPHSILNDSAMEEEMTLRHGMVLALHLIKLLKSSRKFVDLMTEKYDSLRDIDCLKPIHCQLQVSMIYTLCRVLWHNYYSFL